MSQTGVAADVVQEAVRLACRAPSIHNSQPWRWVFEGSMLHLFLDRGRLVLSADRSGREAILSCGAVLDHLRIAMVASGWQATIIRFPDPHNRDHLASLGFRPLDMVTVTQHGLAQAILHRRTDRLPMGHPTYWASFEAVLRTSVDNTVAMLDVLPDEVRPQLAAASRLTAELRRDDDTYHAELQWWTSPFAVSEGVPPEALTSASEGRRVDVARDFPTRAHADRRKALQVDSSTIVVLSTPEDTRADVLGCGEALSTVLLECTAAGMATCPLSHLIEVDDSRAVIRRLIDNRGNPQVLIRIGIAPAVEIPPPATPRRPLADVFQIR